MNILIVQRDREIQKYLKKGLKELGYTVEMCSDRDDAYYHIKSDNYDLAILDIDIENGNGIELCSEIREINKKIGIIFLSSENDIDRVYKYDEDFILYTKGLDNAGIKKLLNQHKLVFEYKNGEEKEKQTISLGNEANFIK